MEEELRKTREEGINIFRNHLDGLLAELEKAKSFCGEQKNFYYDIDALIKKLNDMKSAMGASIDKAQDIAGLNKELKELKYGE